MIKNYLHKRLDRLLLESLEDVDELVRLQTILTLFERVNHKVVDAFQQLSYKRNPLSYLLVTQVLNSSKEKGRFWLSRYRRRIKFHHLLVHLLEKMEENDQEHFFHLMICSSQREIRLTSVKIAPKFPGWGLPSHKKWVLEKAEHDGDLEIARKASKALDKMYTPSR